MPFVFEELFIGGKDILPANGGERLAWRLGRAKRLLGAGLVSSLLIVPIVLVDSHAYGRWTFPTLNIILYNLFSTTGGSPDLYGTSPPTFYLANLFLNFNLLLPLALLSLPALAVTYKFDYRRLGSIQRRPVAGETSHYTLLALRLTGFYLWLAVLSAQPHKEERFMWPAYPLLGLNACVTLFLVRGWIEKAFASWKSPYQVDSLALLSASRLWADALTLIPPFLSLSLPSPPPLSLPRTRPPKRISWATSPLSSSSLPCSSP